jgi:hypothetical protein
VSGSGSQAASATAGRHLQSVRSSLWPWKERTALLKGRRTEQSQRECFRTSCLKTLADWNAVLSDLNYALIGVETAQVRSIQNRALSDMTSQ